MKSLNIVFMGTPEFAVASLDRIVKSPHHIVGVITTPDRPAGRGRQLSLSAVKKYALQHQLPILQPEKLRDENFLASLKTLGADLFVVVAFRMLPEVVWKMPPLGTINLHGSLLPQYRGAAPINHAIMNGEKETGVTTFFLCQEIDTGNIIRRSKLPIGADESAGELHDRMMYSGANVLIETIDAIASGNAVPIPQENLLREGEEITIAPKIFKEDCRICWAQSTAQVHNFIRGLSPYPAAWTILRERTIRIFSGHPVHSPSHGEAGTWHTDGKAYLHFYTSDGEYAIDEIQIEGKKRMPISEFLRGFII